MIAIGLPVAYGFHAHDHAGGLRSQLAELGFFTSACALLGSAIAFWVRVWPMCLLDRMRAEQKNENQRFHTAINNISQGLCLFDGQHRLIVCNRRYAEIYHLTIEQIPPGTTLGEIIDRRYAAGSFSDMNSAQYLAWRAAIAVSDKASDTVTVLADGRTIAIHHEPMPDGGWVSTREDITERRRAVAQIERLAHHDALTALPNRVLFRERLNEALAFGGGGASIAVLCIDLDRLKDVNDTLGHPVGDELLRLRGPALGRVRAPERSGGAPGRR